MAVRNLIVPLDRESSSKVDREFTMFWSCCGQELTQRDILIVFFKKEVTQVLVVHWTL